MTPLGIGASQVLNPLCKCKTGKLQPRITRTSHTVKWFVERSLFCTDAHMVSTDLTLRKCFCLTQDISPRERHIFGIPAGLWSERNNKRRRKTVAKYGQSATNTTLVYTNRRCFRHSVAHVQTHRVYQCALFGRMEHMQCICMTHRCRCRRHFGLCQKYIFFRPSHVDCIYIQCLCNVMRQSVCYFFARFCVYFVCFAFFCSRQFALLLRPDVILFIECQKLLHMCVRVCVCWRARERDIWI